MTKKLRAIIAIFSLLACIDIRPSNSQSIEEQVKNAAIKANKVTVWSLAISQCAVKYETMRSEEVGGFISSYMRQNLSHNLYRSTMRYLAKNPWRLDDFRLTAQKVINKFGGCHNVLKLKAPVYLPKIKGEEELITDWPSSELWQ